MIRSLIMALAAILLNSAAAHAGERFSHNGSVVEFEWVGEGDGFEIRYLYPRSGLPLYPRTLLFHGDWTASGYIYGTAYVFSRDCGPIGYRVEGHSTGNDFVLDGAAPVRDRWCTVVRWEWNDNSHLYFQSLE